MKSTAYDQLMELLMQMEIVDTHEHLPSEKARVESTPDFSTLFCHYCRSDLCAAGMTQSELDTFLSPTTAVDEKWRIFKPYYRQIQDGSYARAAHIAMEKFYGLSRLTSLKDAKAVTDAIRKANKPGLYKKVLKDACKIRISLTSGGIHEDKDYFASVVNLYDETEVTKFSIRGIEDDLGVSCGNLSSYMDAVWERCRRYKEQGMIGIKVGVAYARDLHFAPRTHAEAEEVFLRITEEGYGWRSTILGYEEMRPLHDYMIHRMAEIAGEMDIPMVFHTGLQTCQDHKPDDSRPLQLWNLLHRYRGTDFVILHAGFPWMEEAAMLAKQYPNAYLDMAWAHLMSPEIATRALKTWVDMVPMSKIMGFGGDYSVVEKVYGHLTLARQNIARALAEKVETGALTLPRAKAWIQAILWGNPKRVYRLDI